MGRIEEYHSCSYCSEKDAEIARLTRRVAELEKKNKSLRELAGKAHMWLAPPGSLRDEIELTHGERTFFDELICAWKDKPAPDEAQGER